VCDAEHEENRLKEGSLLFEELDFSLARDVVHSAIRRFRHRARYGLNATQGAECLSYRTRQRVEADAEGLRRQFLVVILFKKVAGSVLDHP
jgi:hypothetical protein